MAEKIGTGKVYKITSSQTDKIYIGSTFEKYLSNRLHGHRKNYKRYQQGKFNFITSFKLLEYDDCEIELIKKYDDITKQELRAKEGKYIKKNMDIVVNKNIAGRIMKQYREDNAEEIKKKNKKYRGDNEERIKQYREGNKEKANQYTKQYYRDNIEKIKQKKNGNHDCECGGKYTTAHKSRHEKTKKHIDYINSN